MNELKNNNFFISIFLLFVLILGKGFHHYLELKKEKEKREEKVLDIVKKHLNNLIISAKSKDNFLIRDSLRPLISLPFITGVILRGQKGDIINVAKENNDGRSFLFLNIPIKDKRKNEIGNVSIYSYHPRIIGYIKENVVQFFLSCLIHLFCFYFILDTLSEPKRVRKNWWESGQNNKKNYDLELLERNPSSVFIISRDLKVEKVLSLETFKTFGRNIENEDVFSLLSSEVTVDSLSYKNLSTTWNLAFSEGEGQFNLIKEQLPKKVNTFIRNKLKTFQASYKVICGNQGEIINIICNLSDITEIQKKLLDYRKGHVENIIVQEILAEKNKKEISQNLERSLRLALNELENNLSRYDELITVKELIKNLRVFLTKINDLNPSLNLLYKEINHINYKVKLWNDTDPLDSLQFEIIENLSRITEVLLAYSRVANKFFNLDLNVTAAIHYKIVDRINNLKSIIGNIFRYVPGLEDLDDSKMKSITKITEMYPDFEGTMELIHKRSRYLAILLHAIREEDLAKKINNLADCIRSIPEKRSIGEEELKVKLVIPYKRFLVHTNDIEEYLRNTYLKEEKHKAS